MDVVNSPWKDNKLAILIIFPFGKFVEVAAAASRLASICAPTSLASVHTVFKFTCKTYSQQTLRQQFHSSRTRKICIIPLPSHHPGIELPDVYCIKESDITFEVYILLSCKKFVHLLWMPPQFTKISMSSPRPPSSDLDVIFFITVLTCSLSDKSHGTIHTFRPASLIFVAVSWFLSSL